MKKKNNVCVIGLGYVGLTLSLHLAKKGIKEIIDIQKKTLA